MNDDIGTTLGLGRTMPGTFAPAYSWHRGAVDGVETSNIALSALVPGVNIDGVTHGAGRTILLVGQTDPTQNGPWTIYSAGDPKRPVHWCREAGMPLGASVDVLSGFKHAGSRWIMDYPTAPVVQDATTMTWRRMTPTDDSLPNAYSYQSMPRYGPTIANLAAALVDGQVMFFRCPLKAGRPINGVQFISGTTAMGTGVNQWAVLTDVNFVVLQRSQDDGATAWAADTAKDFNFDAQYLPTADAWGYIGLMVNVSAGSVPSLWGTAHGGVDISGLDPMSAAVGAGGLGARPAINDDLSAGVVGKQHHVYFGLI